MSPLQTIAKGAAVGVLSRSLRRTRGTFLGPRSQGGAEAQAGSVLQLALSS
jgi:hypothetical protein